jgi:diaminopimelate decarboxylase
VGPICESGDRFCQNREISEVKEGDLLAIMSAGAYGMTMASNYNGRPIPAEVLVNDKEADYLRIRESIQTSWRYEGIPGWLIPEEKTLPPNKRKRPSKNKKENI